MRGGRLHAAIPLVAPDGAPETLRQLAATADALIVRPPLPDDIFDSAPRAVACVRNGAGLDRIPVERATALGIPVANAPGGNAHSVAEFCLALMLSLACRLAPIARELHATGWHEARTLLAGNRELTGKTLGILGVGAIGSRLAQICHHGLGMRVLGCQRRLDHLPPFVAPATLTQVFSYIYWTLNPNSGDTGGVLLDDWQTADPAKRELLSGHQYPLIGIEQIGPEPADRLASPTPIVSTEQVASPTPPVSGSLRVLYRSANPAEISRDSKVEFIITNTGSTPVSLEAVDLNYWFTDNSDQPFVFHCDWAEIGCANVLGEFLNSPDGGSYLRIHYQAGLEPLLPGQDTGEIKIRFNRADWSEFHQADDYSFSPVSEYQDWERVTLAVNGQAVWGSQPGITSTTDLPPCTATPVPVTPTSSLPALRAEPEETAAEEGSLPDPTLPSQAPTPPAQYPYPSPGIAREMWAVTALAVFVAFATGFLVAAVLLGRKNR